MINAAEFRAPPPGPWLLAPQHAEVTLRSAYGRQRPAYRSAASMRSSPAPQSGDHVAIIPIRGVITHRNQYVGTPTLQIAQELDQALAASSVKMILLDVDSHGGAMPGIPELVDQIYAARQKTPIVAVANSYAGCAAYWLASAADMLFCTPSGMVGGLGCVEMHVNMEKQIADSGLTITVASAGKYKVEGNWWSTLSDEGFAFEQSVVDEHYRMMVKSIARNRGVSPEKVHTGYGEGRMLLAKEGHKAGIVDGVLSRDDVLVAIARTLQKEGARARSEAWKNKALIDRTRKLLDDISRN